MKRTLFCIPLIILFLQQECFGIDTELLRIRRTSSSSSEQVYLVFDQLPQHTKVVKGKRVDVILDARLTNTEPPKFEVDDKIVKFLTQPKGDKSVVTFFMRYDPQRVEISSPQSNTLVVDIMLGNQFTKAYPELTSKLEGLSVVTQQTTDFANPAVANEYQGNWNLFFSTYEPELVTHAPIRYTLPPFPVISLLSDSPSIDLLPDSLFDLLPERLWEDMIPILYTAINTQQDLEIKKLLALTYGEILLRAERYNDGFKQLYLLKESYTDEPVGIAAAYLLALLRATYEDKYLASYELEKLTDTIHVRFPLSPFILLSQIESSLDTEKLEAAGRILERDDIAYPPNLAQIKQLRQADYWFTRSQYVRAFVGYSLMADEHKHLFREHPFSMNGYCSTLYMQKKFEQSAECYQTLSSSVKGKEELSSIALKKALAELHFKSPRDMYVTFSTLEDTYPGTAAGFRAALKKTDVRYLSQPSWRKTSVQYYRALAEKSTDRDIAEEAFLKEAIAYSQISETSASIKLLMEFLRNFRKSGLTTTAQALLIEILPIELERLIEEEQYVNALVLAKRNRELFQNNWVDLDLLSMLAKAYHQLSIFEEARNLYLYLLKTSDTASREKYYLPLITILHQQKDFELVEDYAAEYSYNYPQGKDHIEIFTLRLESLIHAEDVARAKKLIAEAPSITPKLREIGGTLFFKEGDYAAVVSYLETLWKNTATLSDDLLFFLAESYFQTGNLGNSQEIFSDLAGKQKFFEQASYRLAEIKRRGGDEAEALKLLRQIVEEGNDPLWIRLATRDLEFSDLKNKY